MLLIAGAERVALLAPDTVRKVAVVRAGRIGDFLCTTPALRALRQALPDAEITLIGLPFLRELVERSALLDHFAEFPGFPGLAEQFFDARRSVDFLRRMQNERFDLAIQMHGSGVNANPFTLLLGARQTVGFIRPGDGPGRLDAALPLPADGHEVHRLSALTTFLGAPPCGGALDFPLTGEDRAEAERLLAGLPEPLIGLHAAARDATKRWNPRRFAAAAAELQARHGGSIVLLGGAEERAALDALARELAAPVRNVAGRTSLPVLGALVRRLAVLLTNDSGPAHIAYALGTPAVVIFGSTDPARWGPLDRKRHRVLAAPMSCRPCGYDEVCPIGLPCLDGVTVRQVVEAAEAIAVTPSASWNGRR
jgi:ADP-heptose:LPS heptosyltransferase